MYKLSKSGKDKDRHLYVLLAFFSLSMFGCKTSSNEETDLKILGGKVVAADDSRFKPIRQLLGVSGNCTATFVTPTKMLTAGHCLANGNDGGFLGIQPGNLPRPSSVSHLGIIGKAAAQPLFGTADGYKDLAILNFASASDLGALPVCTSGPTVEEAVYMVGYGLDESGFDGIKRYAATKVAEITANGNIKIEGEKSAMPGDSGGPLISVNRACIMGIASYIEVISATKYRSFYIDLTLPKVTSFLSSNLGTGSGGSTLNLTGKQCSGRDTVRKLNFLSAREVRDISSAGSITRSYVLSSDVLTIKLSSSAEERYKVRGSGELKLVPSRNNAEVIHFICKDDNNQSGANQNALIGKHFENEDGFTIEFVNSSRLKLDNDADLIPYSISQSTLIIKLSNTHSSKYSIRKTNGNIQLVSDDINDKPYSCSNCN